MEKQYAQNPAIENILTRRSVRSYTDQDVEPEKLEAILEAGMAAPSGKNGQPWDFIVLTRREILDEMAERLPYAKMLREARVAIAVCADRTKSPYWYVDCSAAAENIPEIRISADKPVSIYIFPDVFCRSPLQFPKSLSRLFPCHRHICTSCGNRHSVYTSSGHLRQMSDPWGLS